MNEGRTGVVIAGGRPMELGGRDASVVEVGGVPMVRRVAERLLEATDELVVECRPDQREAVADALAGLDPTFAVEAASDRGHVAGVARGLRAAEAPLAAVVAADLPFLDPGLVASLFERASGHDAAVPRPGDWFEPLHAVYRPEPMADACETVLEAGEGGLLEAAFSLDCIVVERRDLVERGSLDSFERVDSPDDLRWAADRLD